MKNGYKRVISFTADKVKGIDRYSRTISFTFNENKEFGTTIGGLISMATYIILALYSYALLKIMFERNGTNNIK